MKSVSFKNLVLFINVMLCERLRSWYGMFWPRTAPGWMSDRRWRCRGSRWDRRGARFRWRSWWSGSWTLSRRGAVTPAPRPSDPAARYRPATRPRLTKYLTTILRLSDDKQTATGSLGHRVSGSFGSSFTSGSPGHHHDSVWDPSFSDFRKKR